LLQVSVFVHAFPSSHAVPEFGVQVPVLAEQVVHA
jgi:hypothetical protein